MSADVILYDRIWLTEYIEQLRHQRELLRLVEQRLQREKINVLPETQMEYSGILLHIKNLARTLDITEAVLKDYLENVQYAAIRRQQQCQNIELPVLFKTN